MERKAVKIKRFNNLLKVSMVWIAIFVFTVLTLEIYVRMRHAYYTRKNREILHKEAGNKANDFIDIKNMYKGMKYYDYHLYAIAPCKTKLATFTEYFCSRSAPDSYALGKGDIVIWMFGGQ